MRLHTYIYVYISRTSLCSCIPHARCIYTCIKLINKRPDMAWPWIGIWGACSGWAFGRFRK